MKNLFWMVLAFVGLFGGFAACSMETDNEAEATMAYFGVCNDIVFADSGDVVYATYISDAIASERMPLVGNRSAFTEKAKTADGYVQNAIVQCNQQAIETYDHVIANVSSSYMRESLIVLYGDSVNFDTLDAFTIDYSLMSLVDSRVETIASYSKSY